MKDLLPFLVVGVTSGSLYGLAGVGLTLTYKTTGVFNFAQGAIAAAAAFTFFTLHIDWSVPWPIAAIAAVGLVGVIGGAVVERVTRDLGAAGPATTVVATVGLLLMVQGLIQWRYGLATRQLEPFIDGVTVRIGGVAVTAQQAVTVVIAASAAGGLYLFFRSSRAGAEMRAVIDDPDLLDLNGRDPASVRRTAWMIGAAFAALTGVLISPFLGLDTVLLTLLVVQAFGAVAIGRFSSLPLTYAGGIALGIGASLLTKWVADEPALGGLPSALPFLVLVVALVVWPPARASGRGRVGAMRVERAPRNLPTAYRPVAGLLGVAAVLAIPELAGPKLPTFTSAAAYVIVFASLGLLTKVSGQLSLCHAAFIAVGATSFSHLASQSGLGLPWLVALVGAGLAVAPVGALVAIPAIRLSGVFLALATFGFAILMERVVYPTALMFGADGLRHAPRPSFAQTDAGLFYTTAAVATAACLLAVAIVRTRLGRLLRGLAETPAGLTTNGLDVSVTRLVVFTVSAFLAGVAGGLFAAATGTIGGAGFGAFNSLLYLVILAVAGRSLLMASILSALALAVAPAYLPDAFLEHQGLLFGTAAVVLVVVDTATIRVRSRRIGERLQRSPARARLAEVAPA